MRSCQVRTTIRPPDTVNFTAFDNRFLGGASIAIADIDGDGRGDLIAGKGAGESPTVRVFSGASIQNRTNGP